MQKVLISEVTRLGRRTHDLLDVIELLHEHKVSLVVYNYKLETLDKRGRVNSMAQFLVTLLADIGRREAETLSERTRPGIKYIQLKDIPRKAQLTVLWRKDLQRELSLFFELVFAQLEDNSACIA